MSGGRWTRMLERPYWQRRRREFGRFVAWSAWERALFAEALGWVGAAHTAVHRLPAARLSRLVTRAMAHVGSTQPARSESSSSTSSESSSSPSSEQVRLIAGAIERAGRRVPRATCLVRALAAHWMLRSRGIASELVLGVPLAPGSFREAPAHAWLEVDGKVVLGGDDEVDEQFARLRR